VISQTFRLNKFIFKFFLLCVFFIYYETKFVPGALHSWLMVIGLILSIPIFVNKYLRHRSSLPLDYLLIFCLFSIIVLGFCVNFQTAERLDFQAYVLMLATYVYVRENTATDTFEFLRLLLKYFLLINGLLVIIQLLSGSYFPARFLAAGDPPLIIASGVSDGPTKNGMLISFALSFLVSGIIFKRIPFSLFDALVFLVGLTSLIISSSRAGLLSFIAVVFFGLLFSFLQVVRRQREYNIDFTKIILFSAFIYISFLIIDDSIGFEIFYAFRDPLADRYGADTVVYKLTTFSDSSSEDRFDTASFFVRKFFESPFHFLSVGFGTGTFEKLYGLNMHNSYLELIFTTGFWGFLAFSLLVGSGTLRALSKKNPTVIVPVIFSLISIMVFMSAHDVLRGRIFWIALGMISAYSYSHSRRDNRVTLRSF